MWLEIGLAGLVGFDGVILTGLPVPSRELSPDFQAKARVSGFLKLWRAPREAGFTEQRFTSRSLRWKDNGPGPLKAQQRLPSLSQPDDHIFSALFQLGRQ